MPRRPRITAAEVRGPRRHLRYPEGFGVTDPPDPAPVQASQKYAAHAALLQHEVARHVVEQMARLGLDNDDVAEQIGVSPEQLRRVLRGESTMSIERAYQLLQVTALRMGVRIERAE